MDRERAPGLRAAPFAPMPPTLKTSRLVLRPLGLGDLEDYTAFWQDAEVVRYISARPFTREESWKRLLLITGHWRLLGFGFFAIEERSSGRFIGEAGFQEMRRELRPSIEGTLETGWGILPAYQGRGYATEAIEAALAWAEVALPAPRYSCIIHPDNRASLRLAARLRFVEQTPADYLGKPVLILRREAPA